MECQNERTRAMIGGWLFEWNGNYRLAFGVAIATNLLACLAIWLAAPRKVRRVSGLTRRKT